MIAKDDDDIFLISIILFYFFEKFINIPIKLYDGIADIKEFFIFFGTKAIRRMGVDCFDKEDEGNPFCLSRRYSSTALSKRKASLYPHSVP